MECTFATESDIKELFELQHVAFESEAVLVGTHDIPPLLETLDDAKKQFSDWKVLKITDGKKIIASVRCKKTSECVEIGRLMVLQSYRKRGLGTQLLLEVEKLFPNEVYELFTCTKSLPNIQLYQRAGYRIFKEEHVNSELSFVYMRKNMHEQK
jgi:predicted GNAT family N-acyltransferase